jgi:hypothetical protein
VLLHLSSGYFKRMPEAGPPSVPLRRGDLVSEDEEEKGIFWLMKCPGRGRRCGFLVISYGASG